MGRAKRLSYVDTEGRTWKEKFLRVNHRSVSMMKDGQYFDMTLARLILITFVGDPPSSNSLGRHLDDDISNNVISNLAWGSKSDNGLDAIRNHRLVMTDARRSSISKTLNGHEVLQATRDKISVSLTGRKQSEASIKKSSESRRGKKRKPHTEEAKAKMSMAALQRTPEQKAKTGASVKALWDSGVYRNRGKKQLEVSVV
jgi:hypothetical protein